MKKTKVDIAILSKTWLKPSEEMFIKFRWYNYVGNPRPNRKEGGLGLLIKDSIKYKELHRSSKSELESLIAELKDEKRQQ